MTLGLAWNSVLVGLGAGLVSMLVGVAVALVAISSRRNAARFWAVVGILSTMSPPFVTANAWLDLTSGVRMALGPDRSGPWMLWVTSVVLGLQVWPLTAGLAWVAWRNLDGSVVESDAMLRGWALIRWVLGPAAGSGVAAGGLLGFVLAIANFSVPVLFQVPVYTEEFWIRFNTRLSATEALASTWPLLVLPLLAAGLPAKGRFRGVFRAGGCEPGHWRSRLGSVRWMAMAMSVAGGVGSVVFPWGSLALAGSTWRELGPAAAAGQAAAWVSAWTALGAAFVAVLAGVGAGSCLVQRSRLRRWVAVISWLPFFVPGILVTLPVLRLTQTEVAHGLGDSAFVLVLGLSVRYAGPAVGLMCEAARRVDGATLEALTLEGAGVWARWRHGVAPVLGLPAAVAGVLLYLLALWDVESIVLLQPPGGETLALRIFNLLHYGHAGQVQSLCVVLVLVAAIPVMLLAMGWGITRRASGRGHGMPAVGLILLGCLGGAGCGRRIERSGAVPGSTLFSGVEIIGSKGVAPGQFHKPRSLTCDRDDNLYVADITGRIQKFSPSGKFVLQWQMPETDLGKPKGMGMDREGHILVVEPHYQRVNVFSGTGTLLHQWGRRGTNAGQLILPRAIAETSTGEWLVSEYTVVDRVQRFGPAGEFRGGWGRPGLGVGEFNRAEGLAVGPGDLVYVADSCNHRIQVFDSTGVWMRSHGRAGSAPGEYSYPYDIRVDSAGIQYVCEFGNSRISVLDRGDRVIEVVGGPGSEPGLFSNPWSLCLDSRGNVYVADSQNHRVQKLIRSGVGGRVSASNLPGGSLGESGGG